MWSRGARDWITNPVINGWTTLKWVQLSADIYNSNAIKIVFKEWKCGRLHTQNLWHPWSKLSDCLYTLSTSEPFHFVSSHLCLRYQQCVHPRFLTVHPVLLEALAANMLESQEWWRLVELAGDRSSMWTRVGRTLQGAPQWSHIIEPFSQYRRGDEIWTPFNIPPNNCDDKCHELPSTGMSWHLDN